MESKDETQVTRDTQVMTKGIKEGAPLLLVNLSPHIIPDNSAHQYNTRSRGSKYRHAHTAQKILYLELERKMGRNRQYINNTIHHVT